MSKNQPQAKTPTPKSEQTSSREEAKEAAPAAESGAPEAPENKTETAPATTENPAPAGEEKTEVTETEEKKEVSPAELRAAVFALIASYAGSELADETIPDGDAVIDIVLSLRMGDSAPIRIEEHRHLRDLLVEPDIASAIDEFEAAMRQILLPVHKAVQREVNRRMSASLALPGAARPVGFIPLSKP